MTEWEKNSRKFAMYWYFSFPNPLQLYIIMGKLVVCHVDTTCEWRVNDWSMEERFTPYASPVTALVTTFWHYPAVNEFPATMCMSHQPEDGLMLGRRRRRRPSNKPSPGQCLVCRGWIIAAHNVSRQTRKRGRAYCTGHRCHQFYATTKRNYVFRLLITINGNYTYV